MHKPKYGQQTRLCPSKLDHTQNLSKRALGNTQNHTERHPRNPRRRRRRRRRILHPLRERNNPTSPLRRKPTARQNPQLPTTSQHQQQQQRSNNQSIREESRPARKEQSRSRQMPPAPTETSRDHPHQRRAAQRDECAAEVVRARAEGGVEWAPGGSSGARRVQ